MEVSSIAVASVKPSSNQTITPLDHSFPTKSPSIPYDFYEVSRRNIAILLIFWISYIIAYLFCVKFVRVKTLFGRGTSYSRRRRSNLSRLMLKSPVRGRSGTTGGLFRSTSRDSSSRAGSQADLSESESRVLSDRELQSSTDEVMASIIGHHILSAFSLEYTLTVMATGLSLQGLSLLPISILWTHLDNGLASTAYWQWLSLSLMQQWWQWLHLISYGALLIGIPLAWAVAEAREYRNAAIIQKTIIVATRLLRPILRFGWFKLVMMVGMLLSGYSLALLLGYVEPWNIKEGLQFANSIALLTLALLSLFCIPSGMFALLRWACNRLTASTKADTLRTHKLEIDERIRALEAEIEEIKFGLDATPISSKSLRSRLSELKLHSADLAEELFLASETLGMRVMRYLIVLLVLVILGLLTLTIIRSWWSFTFSELLWYFPGVRLVDRILFKLASTVRLIEEPTIKSKISWYPLFLAMGRPVLMSLFFSIGLLKGMRRQKRSISVFGLTRHKFPITLEQLLAISAILICTMTISSPLILVSGIVDDFYKKDRVGYHGYLPTLTMLLPPFNSELLQFFHDSRFLRFPVSIWLIFGYRSGLSLTLLYAMYRSLGVVAMAFSDVLRRRHRSSTHLHND